MSVIHEFPEHERLKAISEDSQLIGEFLDIALPKLGLVLAEADEDGWLWPTRRLIPEILATHFAIDQKKIDAEKDDMLRRLREANLIGTVQSRGVEQSGSSSGS